MKTFKRFLIVLIPLIAMAILLVIFSILKTNSNIAEWWTLNISKPYYFAMGYVTKYIPLSLTELFFTFLAVSILITVIKIFKDLKHKRWWDSLKRVGIISNMVLSIILIYALTCEMAYNRKPIDLPYYEQEVDVSEYKDIYNYYADDVNECISQLEFTKDGDLVTDLSFRDISILVNESIEKNITSDYFYKNSTYAKPMVSSIVYRELGITGFTHGPLVESIANYLATNLELPFTIAHEMAHVKGVMREDDANQFAFYVCLNSDSPYLRLSAYGLYFNQLTMMASPIYISKEDYNSLHSLENNFYYARIYAANYWKQHNLVKKIGDWINSFYIESSGVPSGTGSYDGGSEVDTDPVTLKMIPSQYQKLFFQTYFKNQP